MDVPWLVALGLLALAACRGARSVWIAACKADRRAADPACNPHRY